MTFSPALVVLYVADVARSRAFYEPIFGAPLEASDSFAMFATPAGARLALWAVDKATPPANLAAGGFELCSGMSESAVDALHAAWSARGVAIVAPPARAEFGYSFVALDPDGHRLRALAPTA